MMTVHELARAAGVTADTVRHYVRIGLLRPQRNPGNNYRLFSRADLRRLRFVRKAQLLGFTLKEICQLLEASRSGALSCAQVRQAVERRIQENRRRLEALMALQRRMEAAMDQWGRLPEGPADEEGLCGLIEALELPEDEPADEALRQA